MPISPFLNPFILKTNLFKPNSLSNIQKQEVTKEPKTTQIRCILCLKRDPFGESPCLHRKSPIFSNLLNIMRPILSAQKKLTNKHNRNLSRYNECSCSSCQKSEEKLRSKNNFVDIMGKYDDDFPNHIHENKHSKHQAYDKCNCNYCRHTFNRWETRNVFILFITYFFNIKKTTLRIDLMY